MMQLRRRSTSKKGKWTKRNQKKQSKLRRRKWAHTITGKMERFRYLEFPFFTDRPSCTELRKRQATMFILRGLPGSGKSTIVACLKDTYKNVVVCSADDYFLTAEGYKYDAGKLRDAHKWCQELAKKCCMERTKYIVIDNTNVKTWEMHPYLSLARQCNYMVIMVHPKTPWNKDPEELALRNKHCVSADVIQAKLTSFQSKIPVYYAWFASLNTSQLFLRRLMKEMINVLKLLPHLRETYGGADSKCCPDRYILAERLHCTSVFAPNNRATAERYGNEEIVQRSLGRHFSLSASSFWATKTTIGYQIKLSSKQLALFGNNEDGCAVHGQRAHISVGWVTRAIEAGYDLLGLLEKIKNQMGTSIIMPNQNCITHFNDGSVFVKFSRPMIIDTIFSGFY